MKRSLLIAASAMLCASAHAATLFPNRTDFRDETIYFAMTTRFYDGDITNNTYCWDGTLNVNDPEWRGDFKGLIEKLDYIKALGFTAVWITPVVENASGLDYHGYHAFNFQKVDPRYESEDCKFQDLIDAAHARGMKIILDIVLNHTGNFGEEYLCPMFVKDYSQNLSNLDKSLKLHPNTVLPDNYMSLAKPHDARIAALKNEDGKNHDIHNHYHHVGNEWNWDDYSRWYGQIAGDCVDLNTENPRVSNYLVKCYGKFIEMGVDGFRIDTSGHISRLTFNNAFIPQFTALAEQYKDKRNGGPFFMYGEVCARDRNVTYRNHDNCSPWFYTWKEDKSYPWDYSETSWDDVVNINHGHGEHVNTASQDQQGLDCGGESYSYNSNNAFLNGNDYHTPDYSKYSNFSVIDFPMHWNFRSASEAWGVRYGDKMYNDASYNVVYVDSHDYAPDGAPENQRFSGTQDTWAENLDLMFTFRGIPCVYYGSEIEFKKGCIIDKGALLALKDSGRAYFGGYLTGNVNVTDFAEYSDANGNIAATLAHPLSLHIQRLNKIRAAVPALRKGQYSTEGCSGTFAFKRRYTDVNTDSYVLVTISGDATFTGILNGVYTDVITGDTKNVTDGILNVTCVGKGNMRAYVLNTAQTPAPGKIGVDGKYLYASSPVTVSQPSYDGNQEAPETVTVRDNGGGVVVEPEDPKDLILYKNETAAFFHNTADWSGAVHAWVWSATQNYTGGTWPGAACEYLGNGYYKWSYGENELPEGVMIIFSGAGRQTKDCVFKNGAVYTADGLIEQTIEESNELNPNDPIEPVEPKEGFTVYFDNSSSNWSSVKVHYWGGESVSTWPGVDMIVTPEDSNIYYYKVPGGTTGLVFNNGNGTQTSDFIAVANHKYDMEGDQGEYVSASLEAGASELDKPIYFNMQGIRVFYPSQGGVYIVRRGDKVSKEYYIAR